MRKSTESAVVEQTQNQDPTSRTTQVQLPPTNTNPEISSSLPVTRDASRAVRHRSYTQADRSLKENVPSAPQTNIPVKVLDYAESQYADFTGRASNVLRALLIAGAGLVCWLAGGGTSTSILAHIQESPLLGTSLALLILGLIADGGQYIYASFAFSRWSHWVHFLWDNKNVSSEKWLREQIGKRYGLIRAIEEYCQSKVSANNTKSLTTPTSTPQTLSQMIVAYFQEQENIEPRRLEHIADVFFWAKVAFTGAAYVVIFVAVIHGWSPLSAS